MPLEYMGGAFATLDDVDVKGKRVIVRFDLNSPVGKDGEILDDSRIVEAAATLRELCDRGAAVVALSHQGRPLEDDLSASRSTLLYWPGTLELMLALLWTWLDLRPLGRWLP